MKKPFKKIGVFTSGGDCAGLNAAIRAVVLHATQTYGWQVVGIPHGVWGIMQDQPQEVPLGLSSSLDDFLTRGGSILGSKSLGPFLPTDNTQSSERFMNHVHKIGLDGLIAIGGDGSLQCLETLCHHASIPLVFIPKTIDNDLPFTESSIGFSSAVEVATEALDRLRSTAASHQRVMILQVMGRDAGHIALHAGTAGGADIILIPEISYTLESLQRKIEHLQRQGRHYALCVVSESVPTPEGEPAIHLDTQGRERYDGIGWVLCDRLEPLISLEVRTTVLGHPQRGGAPTPYDRILASALGVHAVDLMAQNKGGRMVMWHQQGVSDIPLAEVIRHHHAVDTQGTMVYTARSLGICFGDTVL